MDLSSLECATLDSEALDNEACGVGSEEEVMLDSPSLLFLFLPGH